MVRQLLVGENLTNMLRLDETPFLRKTMHTPLYEASLNSRGSSFTSKILHMLCHLATHVEVCTNPQKGEQKPQVANPEKPTHFISGVIAQRSLWVPWVRC